MSPEPSTSCHIMAGGEEKDSHRKPKSSCVRKKYSSCLLDSSFGTSVDETDSEDQHETDAFPPLVSVDEPTTTQASSTPEKFCSQSSQAAEEDTTIALTEEGQHDINNEDEISYESDDFSLTSDLGFSQEEDDFCHDYHHQGVQENQAATGGRRLAFIFDMFPVTGRGGGGTAGAEAGGRRRQQRSSSMGLGHGGGGGGGGGAGGNTNQSIAGVGGGVDALSKSIHGYYHHVSSGICSGFAQQRVSDYEKKRRSCSNSGANDSTDAPAAERGRESYPSATSRGRPTLLSPTNSWGRPSLSPVPRKSWGGSNTGGALSPVRNSSVGASHRRKSSLSSPWRTRSTRNTNSFCPRGGSNATKVPLDLSDLDCWGNNNEEHSSVGGGSFKTFNTMNMDHSPVELQRNISGSAFATAGADLHVDLSTSHDRRTSAAKNKRTSTTTGQKLNSFVENQFTTFARNVDGMQEKFEKMITNIGETAQVIQEEPNSRVLGAVVQARLSCFAGNLQHIGKSTCFVQNIRTICGLPNSNNQSNKDNNSHPQYYGDDFDKSHQLYSHQDKMY